MAKGGTLRVAVIGCGFVGKIHAQAIRQCPHAELVAVCDVDAGRAHTLAQAMQTRAVGSLSELFDVVDLDVVTIATPDDQHVFPTKEALQRGLHVFCEKPLASSSSEAQLLSELARKFGVQLGVDYNRRFGFGYQMAKELVSAAVSPPRQAILQVTDGIPGQVAHLPFALLTSLASHHLDLFRWLGGEPSAIQATMRGPSLEHPHEASIVIEFKSGMTSLLAACWRSGQTRTWERLQLVSDDRMITVDDVQQKVSVWATSPDIRQQYQPNYFHSGNQFYDTVRAHLCKFLDAVASGDKAPVTADDGVATLQMIEAAIESSQKQRVVELNHVRSAP